MKSLKYLTLIFCIFSIISCEEEPPGIILEEQEAHAADTTYVLAEPHSDRQEKRVYFEYFTGVECANCPEGMERAKELAGNNPGRLMIVSNHAGGFANAQNDGDRVSKYDFKLEETQQLYDALQAPGAPTAAVDRTDPDNNRVYPYTRPSWPDLINQRLDVETPINIEISAEVSGDDIRVQVESMYFSEFDETHRITVILTESNLIDWQIDTREGGWVEDYSHDFVARKYLTPFNGNILSATLERGRVFETHYAFDASIIENIESASVVAFVHNFEHPYEVYQVSKTAIE